MGYDTWVVSVAGAVRLGMGRGVRPQGGRGSRRSEERGTRRSCRWVEAVLGCQQERVCNLAR